MANIVNPDQTAPPLMPNIIMWLYLGNQGSVTTILITFSVEAQERSKIWNTFLFLLSTKLSVIRAGIHKLLVKIANREDPDQTASS